MLDSIDPDIEKKGNKVTDTDLKIYSDIAKNRNDLPQVPTATKPTEVPNQGFNGKSQEIFSGF